MSKETVHFEALGYEPFRMKPVHFAAGFFLSLTNARYELEMLNKTAVIKHKTGLRDDYAHDNLHGLLCEQQVLDPSVSVDELKLLRVQLNGIVGNDDAIYGSFKPYKKPPGVAYTVVSSRYLYDEQPLDGFSGYFVHQVLAHTTQGKAVLDFARMRMEHHASTLEQLVAPLLDGEGERQPFGFDYEQTFGKLNAQRLGDIAADMAAQTQALEVLCQNLVEHASHATQLRGLTIGLCSWLFVYLHRRATAAHGLSQRAPLFLMDFLGGSNPRLRAASRLSFARQRGLVFESYKAFRAREVVKFLDTDFSPKGVGSADFSFLEQHYSDLAVRIGFAQPRAFQARRKHFELQPDTARLLVQSVISPTQPLVTVEEVANDLRKVWGVSFGGCDDDLAVLRDYGHTGFDEDDDLKPNREAFVDLLKRLNLAAEPSDGLVLCAVKREELP